MRRGAAAVVTKQGNAFFPVKRKQFTDLAKNVFPHQCKDG